LLGFLDRLGHVVTLLLSGVHREDGHLVELDAVQKGRPETNMNALVRTSIYSNPGVLGVHFLDNFVPLGLLVTNNKQTEHLVCLLRFGNSNDLLSLEDLFKPVKHLLLELLGFFSFVLGEVELGHHLLSNLKNSMPGHLDFGCQSFLLDDA
jgi:hypothetical protein